ncbi:MAG: type II secretion system F family protein [Ruminococcus sp.]
MSRDTVNNSYLRSQFDGCIKSIRVGNALSESIMAMDGFDSKLGDTIKVGEETGKLDAMLPLHADDYEYESSAAIKSMMSIIEPLMIVILGIVVAGVMVSVLVPMYSMYGNIDENTTAVFAWIGRTLGRFWAKRREKEVNFREEKGCFRSRVYHKQQDTGADRQLCEE